jgi:RNA polymerase nonessential primary-like sigma factor
VRGADPRGARRRLELTRERVRQIQLEALGQLRRIIKRRGVSKDVLL